jgi:Zn-dependent protease
MPTRRGSFRIFRLLGIDVYLHWTWFVVAVIQMGYIHYRQYSSPVWYALEYLALFGMVLMHEFGHALACRQVGGQANTIVLWPLGGVAYVSPPQRPGAMLWSIAAGPLVNVGLFPILFTFWICSHLLGLPESMPDLHVFITTLLEIDIGLLIFNMLPFYPLDGGQILHSLLWFLFGRAKSLMIACVIGFFGIGALGLLALLTFDPQSITWIGVLCLFMAFNCWGSFRYAKALSKLESAPRRPEFNCPACRERPPLGEFWTCSRCRKAFDTFVTQGFCPHCNAEYPITACPFCHSLKPTAEWHAFQTPAAPPRVQPGS